DTEEITSDPNNNKLTGTNKKRKIIPIVTDKDMDVVDDLNMTSMLTRNKKSILDMTNAVEKWLLNPQITCNNRFEQLINLDEETAIKGYRLLPIFMDADNLQPLTSLITTYDNQI
ncbi:hypothetical protein KPH14_012603, partial [Odynerus spinipes]